MRQLQEPLTQKLCLLAETKRAHSHVSSSASQLPSAFLQVGSHCSDLQELIGGQPWILVRMPAKADASADEAKLSGVDKVLDQAACVRSRAVCSVEWLLCHHPPAAQRACQWQRQCEQHVSGICTCRVP